MVDKSIIDSIQHYLRELKKEGIPVAFNVLFGSQTTGKTDEWSDIDLVVVSPLFDSSRNHEAVGQLWWVAAYTDNRIAPIACGEKQWQEDDFTPIFEIARTEGITVKAKNVPASPMVLAEAVGHYHYKENTERQ